MDDIKAKQQVIEKIKEASKILVTVSNSPSVDALSAALGLTLLFDKQEKYATAIFSGEVPPAIAFLEPEKTFDETTDSLRDFIIALNKEKADHLRYKVEGDSVKIFITPYKTTINQDDLQFSQGDYNVELVIALGVDSQDHLDEALENHGKILHDATVITVSAGEQTSDLGGIDWHDASASSLSEMVTSLAESLKEDKKKWQVDTPIATALLTGIVAETERFSNQHTTSRSMTVAAQLMAAGADQQLIATELQAGAITAEAPKEEPETVEEADEAADDGSQGNISIKKDELSIKHDDTDDDKETLADLEKRVHSKEDEPAEAEEPAPVEEPQVEEPTPEPVVEEPVVEAPQPEVIEEKAEEAPEETEELVAPETPTSDSVANVYALDEDEIEPSLGGTLNATTEQAADDARREANSDQNKTILSHAYVGEQPQKVSNPIGGSEPIGFPGTPPVAPGSVGINQVEENPHPVYAFNDPEKQETVSAPTYGTGGEKVIAPLEPIAPVSVAPTDLGLPLPPPLPDFSQSPLGGSPTLPPLFPVETAPVVSPTTQSEILGDILAPEAPAQNSAYAFEPIETPIQSPTPPVSNDPGQFKIPS